jgi:hypothetical protein
MQPVGRLVAVAFLLAACDPGPDPDGAGDDPSGFDAALGDCPDPAPAHADVEPVFDDHCTRCHHSARTDPEDRSFAPPGRDWDLPSSIRAAGPALLWSRIHDGAMPPDAAESLLESDPDDARDLYSYLSCGAPD